jgi:hypothetical protein
MKTLFLASLLAGACFAAAADTGAAASKSIIDPKYRNKKEPDWMASQIALFATRMKTVAGKEVSVEGSNPPKTTKLPDIQKPDGVNVDALFALATINNLDVEKFRDQVGSHGFEGRFRMTVSNMLRAAARNRHGVFFPTGKGGKVEWHDAPADFLANSKPPAPKEATHNKDGSKIAKAKPAAAAEPEAKAA